MPPCVTRTTRPFPKARLVLAFAIAASAVTSGIARAEPIVFAQCVTGPCIDFGNTRQPGGTVSYDGSGGPLLGIDLPILGMNGLNTPLNSTPPVLTTPVINGRLNFQTGPLAGTNPLTGYEFSGGGFFTITGAVPAVGLSDVNTVLLSGVFSGATFGFGPPTLPLQFMVSPRGVDVKNAVLMSYFGLNPGTMMSFGGFVITNPPVGGLGGGPFSVTALNVDIPNAPTAPVPEPASLILLGTGLAGAVGAARRKRK